MNLKKIIIVFVALALGFFMYGISYEGWFLNKLNQPPDEGGSTSRHRSVRSGGFHHGK